MFKNNLVSFQNVFEGCLADIETPCGEYLASGFYSGISHVCVRVLTRRPDEKIDEDFFRKRISFALDYRMVSMRENFDNCRLVLQGGVYYAEIRGVRFRLSEFQQKALGQNGQDACDIVAGIRPQHITVGEGDLRATVEVSEMMGSEYNIHARSNDDEVVMVVPTVGLETDVSMGAVINFTTDPDLIQLFDKATGNNLIWYDEASVAANEPVCRSYDL